MSLKQILYVSSYVDEYGLDLPELIANFVSANETLGIQGMTLFSNGNIMQLLEGQHQIVIDVVVKLKNNIPQFGLVTLLDQSIASLNVSETSIGFSSHEFRAVSKRMAKVAVFKLTPAEVERRIVKCSARELMVQFASNYQ